jgi:hypothetical protein
MTTDTENLIKPDYELRFSEIKETQKDHERRIKSLEESFARQDEKQKQIFQRLGEIKQLLTTSMENMSKNNEKAMKDIKDIIKPVSDDVEILKGKPLKTWEIIKYSVITALISGGIGLIIGQLLDTGAK